jgi:trimethylamine---corrinoid protein Co-methyltransferase
MRNGTSRDNRTRNRRQLPPVVHFGPFGPSSPLRNPQPPYRWLDDESLESIHQASLTILEEIGLDFLDAEALSLWAGAGARVDFAAQHVWIDRGLVLDAVASAPPTFTWRARNPARDVLIGGNHIAFGPTGGMVYVQDLSGGRRVGTMADLETLMKLAQVAGVLHFGCWEQVTPQDVPLSQRHLRRLYAGLTLTDKPVMEAAHGRIISADNIAMACLALGLDPEDEDAAAAGPVMGDVINVNSPLRYDARMLGGLITYARARQATFITPFILAGAMSPISMAAALAQQNAEALAGIALTQIARPGAPVIYGGFTTNVDMRSGSPAFGTPEGAWALLVGAQLARRYRLPYRASGGLTNAKLPDAQAAYETAWNLWPAILAHANLVMHAAGWLEGGLTVSLEKFIIDLENLAMFARFVDGFAVNEETLALNSIAAVGPGGHHFGTAHTQARFRSEHYQSALADRQSFDSWVESGSEDSAQRAHRIWREALAAYTPPPMDVAVREALADFVARRTRELEGANLYE